MTRTLAILLAAAATFMAAAASEPPVGDATSASARAGDIAVTPNEQPLGTRLLRGRLIGTSMEPGAGERTADAPVRMAFNVLILEDYTNITGIPVGPAATVQAGPPVDFTSIDAASLAAAVTELLPADVRLGDEVLVAASMWRTRRPFEPRHEMVSIERCDEESTQAFLRAHASIILDVVTAHLDRRPFDPQRSLDEALRLRAEADKADGTDDWTALKRRHEAWATLMTARGQAHAQRNVAANASKRLSALEAVAAAGTPEAATLRASLDALHARLAERQRDLDAMIAQLEELAGPQPKPPADGINDRRDSKAPPQPQSDRHQPARSER